MLSALIMFFSIFTILFTPQFLHANLDPKSYFYPGNSNPYGKSYPEWSAIWWKFVLEYPVQDARLTDLNGDLCAKGQSGNVWILPGASSGTVNTNFIRDKCVIPSGVSLLISPDDNRCSTKEHPNYDKEQLTDCANDSVFKDDSASAKLDGIDLIKITKDELNSIKASDPSRLKDVNYFESDVFDLYYPPGEGPYKAVSSGIFLMLKPLPPGQHTLNLAANQIAEDWAYNLTYVLTQK
jgi:hypothetical protein